MSSPRRHSPIRLGLRWLVATLVFAVVLFRYRLVYKPDVFHGNYIAKGNTFFEGLF